MSSMCTYLFCLTRLVRHRLALVAFSVVCIGLNTLTLVLAQDTSEVATQVVTEAANTHRSTSAWPKTFRDWWQTPAQQAASAWKRGDNERLRKVAPSAQWEGAAAYRQSDFEAAKTAFAGALERGNMANTVFNQATTDIQLGHYAAAIEQLDTVLAEQPNHSDAARNRAIAERLLELEQQSQQGEGEGQGEAEESEGSKEGDESKNSDNNGDSSNSSESDEQQGASDNSQGDDSPQSEGESSEAGDPSEDSSQGAPSNSDTTSDEDIEAARQALQAAGEQGQENAGDTQPEQLAAELSDEPLSEEDQATEQWLRQIPDDPDDLLRQKIMQNHRSEYPDVQVNGRGW